VGALNVYKEFDMVGGMLLLKDESEAGTDMQYALKREEIDPKVFLQIKKLFAEPVNGPPYPTHHANICKRVSQLLEGASPRKRGTETEWEKRARAWNSTRDAWVKAALQELDQLKSCCEIDTILPANILPGKTGKDTLSNQRNETRAGSRLGELQCLMTEAIIELPADSTMELNKKNVG
jgi:hypothetical protein